MLLSNSLLLRTGIVTLILASFILFFVDWFHHRVLMFYRWFQLMGFVSLSPLYIFSIILCSFTFCYVLCAFGMKGLSFLCFGLLLLICEYWSHYSVGILMRAYHILLCFSGGNYDISFHCSVC